MTPKARDLEGKLVVVTGGSSGIGAETVIALARRGATVVSSYRDAARAEAIAERARTFGGNVVLLPLDLEAPASIRAFAANVERLGRPVDTLVQNAGVVYRREKRTEEGLDAQEAVIHFGPLLLTHLLVPSFARPARIVDVVSDLHRRVGTEELVRPSARYGFVASYARAELRKLLVSRELARRLAPRVDVNGVHPGGVRTSLFRDVNGPLGLLFAAAQALRMSPRAGARSVVHVACEVPPGTTGRYFVNGRFGVRAGRPSRVADDEALARRIYEEDCARLGVEPFSA